MKIQINNSRLLCAKLNLDQTSTLEIVDNKITSHRKTPDFNPDKIIDAKNNWVIPGLIDLKAQAPDNDNIASTGITAISAFADTPPILDNPAIIQQLKNQKNNPTKIFPIGALSPQLKGEALSDLKILKEAGCVAFTNNLSPFLDKKLIRYAYEFAASFDYLIIICPLDAELHHKGCVHEGMISTRLGLSGIPETAETIALQTHLLLVEQTGVRAHFTGLTCARSIEIIKQAKARGLNITCDIYMHHLHLTEIDVIDFNSHCHLIPPLRTHADKLGLIEGVKSGVIDAICSDHKILSTTAKLAPFAETTPGLSGVDTFLALGLHFVNQYPDIDLLKLLSCITYTPAQILGLNTGCLAIGAPADICIVDPTDDFSCTTKHSPFHGWHLSGRVRMTLIEGEIVYDSTNRPLS